jgi:phosphatidylserine decarboxylase
MRWQTLYEGRWIFAILAVLAIASLFVSIWLAVLFLLLIAYTFAFFRDPERVSDADDDSVVAAADGVVADIVEIEEGEVVKTTMRRVGIFLSVFDVHTNRAPVAAGSLTASTTKGSASTRGARIARARNESMTWAFENPRATLVVKQLTGAIARRIVGLVESRATS